MGSHDAHFVARLYESVATDTGLEQALAALHNAFECVGSSILFFDPLSANSILSLGAGAMDAESRRIYQAEFAQFDPAPLAFSQLPSGSVTSTNRLFPIEFRDNAIVLQEFLRPRGIDETIAGAISAGGGRLAMLALYRGAGRRIFDDADFARVQNLLPHVAMALRLRRTFEGLEMRAAALSSAIDRLPVGVAILGSDTAIHVNRTAELIGRRNDGIWFDRKGYPHAANREAEILLQAHITDARGGGAGGIVRVPRPTEDAPYVLLAAPLLAPSGADPHDGEETVIVMIHDPSSMSELAPEAIMAAFDLPLPAAEMLAALLGGEEAAAYAARRGISYETVRYHLKTAFARTGSRTRARLLQSIATVLRDLGDTR